MSENENLFDENGRFIPKDNSYPVNQKTRRYFEGGIAEGTV